MQTLLGEEIPGSQTGEVSAATRGPDVYVPVDAAEANVACRRSVAMRVIAGSLIGVVAALLTYRIARGWISSG